LGENSEYWFPKELWFKETERSKAAVKREKLGLKSKKGKEFSWGEGI